MFNNLIESSSHAKEFKRRGSFLLFTTVTYVVLFAIAGVVSVFAYDAHLERQNTELELIGYLPVEPLQATPPEMDRSTIRPASPTDRTPTESTRTQLISSTADPSLVPDNPGTKAVTGLPALPHSKIGAFDGDPPVPTSGGSAVPGGTGTAVVEMPEPPPAPPAQPAPTPVKIHRISVVLNSQATYLPKPIYPPIAKQIRQHGTVTVLVLINESGNVVSAKATAGPPLLAREAEKAALQARFSPTVLTGQPVKVSGVITYNFVLN